MWFPQILFTHHGAGVDEEKFSLDQLQLSPKITIDKGKEELLADGTVQIASETISIETAVFRCDKDYADHLLFFNNRLIDVRMFDVAMESSPYITLRGCRVSVSLIAQNDDSALIKLTATREVNYRPSYDGVPPFQISSIESHALVKITLLKPNGTPSIGSYVSFRRADGLISEGNTNALGEAFCLCRMEIKDNIMVYDASNQLSSFDVSPYNTYDITIIKPD